MLPVCQPLPVISKPRPFDGAEWLYELKYDGFRALAYLGRLKGSDVVHSVSVFGIIGIIHLLLERDLPRAPLTDGSGLSCLEGSR